MNDKPWYDLSDYNIRPSGRNAKAEDFNAFDGIFSERNRFNIPGPIYCGQTDNCLTGRPEAPDNIMFDCDGYEFIYCQPINLYELENVVSAANVDPFCGYAADGNEHWTLSLIRDWWNTRYDLLSDADSLRKWNNNVDEWQSYLNGPAIEYLRQYAFYIEEGRLPEFQDHLPRL
ncbi:hypothetical protein [uncultured Gimesia sp.]|mgnify:CR=1 FL=1|uniref:hypothetical protein n=1 Tax=uncultured Gimesia sp. TaxID=1678688 RepID=UPI0030DCB51E|tara:strand:+ start:114536 stop:115057 length:522 start_codon:yes stop_codon:yes gene_type:complete